MAPTYRSRFRSPRVQDVVVALTMLVLLMGSVVVAGSLSIARSPHAVPAQVQTFLADDLKFHLPATWEQVAGPEDGGAVVWADSDRPARRLGLLHVNHEAPVDPREVMARYLPMFMGARVAREVQKVDSDPHPHPQLSVYEWVGVSSGGATKPRVHLAASLTPDNRSHYLFYLIDELREGEDPRSLLLTNLVLLRAVHQGAALVTPTDPSPGVPEP